MEKRTIRYRRPEWKNWVYVVVKEKEVEEMVTKLEKEGYIVER
jgi:hypothetical protein